MQVCRQISTGDGRIRKFVTPCAPARDQIIDLYYGLLSRGKDGVTSCGLSRRLSRLRPLYRLPCNRLLHHTNEKKIRENLSNNANSAMSCHLIRAIETLLPRCTSWKLSCFCILEEGLHLLEFLLRAPRMSTIYAEYACY